MSPTEAFPRALLEMWNDPIRELNFKYVGTASGRNFSVLLGDHRQQQMFKGLKQKPVLGKVPGPKLGSREVENAEAGERVADVTHCGTCAPSPYKEEAVLRAKGLGQ